MPLLLNFVLHSEYQSTQKGFTAWKKKKEKGFKSPVLQRGKEEHLLLPEQKTWGHTEAVDIYGLISNWLERRWQKRKCRMYPLLMRWTCLLLVGHNGMIAWKPSKTEHKSTQPSPAGSKQLRFVRASIRERNMTLSTVLIYSPSKRAWSTRRRQNQYPRWMSTIDLEKQWVREGGVLFQGNHLSC